MEEVFLEKQVLDLKFNTTRTREIIIGLAENEKKKLFIVLLFASDQIIHEVLSGSDKRSATMAESSRLAAVERSQSVLDVPFWQFKHIKLIFIYVRRSCAEGSESQDTLFALMPGGSSGERMETSPRSVVTFNLTSSSSSIGARSKFARLGFSSPRKPHGTIKLSSAPNQLETFPLSPCFSLWVKTLVLQLFSGTLRRKTFRLSVLVWSRRLAFVSFVGILMTICSATITTSVNK